MLVILGVAAYLRLHDLTDLPPPLHPDEAGQGISGLELMDGKQPLLGFGWAYHLNTAYLLSGLVLKLFGATVWNLRVTEAAFGITAVVVTYLLGRSMFSWRVGLVASALLAFNHFALAFSRIGLVNQQSMTVQLVAFLLLWEGFRRRRPLLTALGGAAAGAGLYLYFASWVVPGHPGGGSFVGCGLQASGRAYRVISGTLGGLRVHGAGGAVAGVPGPQP